MARTRTRKPPDTSPTDPAPPPPLTLEWRSPAELAENPRNWRTHPPAQLTALTGTLAEVGWAGACLFNRTTGRLIDGHARRKVALEQGATVVPVLVGNWTEDQERKILATLDPLAAMAQQDNQALAGLLKELADAQDTLAPMVWPDHVRDNLATAEWAPPAEGPMPDAQRPAPNRVEFTPDQWDDVQAALAAARERTGDPDLNAPAALVLACQAYLGGAG